MGPCSIPIHYLEQSWILINRSPDEHISLKKGRYLSVFIDKIVFKFIICNVVTLLSTGIWVIPASVGIFGDIVSAILNILVQSTRGEDYWENISKFVVDMVVMVWQYGNLMCWDIWIRSDDQDLVSNQYITNILCVKMFDNAGWMLLFCVVQMIHLCIQYIELYYQCLISAPFHG